MDERREDETMFSSDTGTGTGRTTRRGALQLELLIGTWDGRKKMKKNERNEAKGLEGVGGEFKGFKELLS